MSLNPKWTIMDKIRWNGPQWNEQTKVERMEPSGLKLTKWTIMDRMDRSGPNKTKWIGIECNRPKWSEMDRCGLNRPKWTEQSQVD